MKNKIIYIVLLLLIVLLVWEFWECKKDRKACLAENSALQDSLERYKTNAIPNAIPPSPNLQPDSILVGATTTTVVALDAANGRPLSGVTVTVYRRGPTSNWITIETGTTNSNGEYAVRASGVVSGSETYKIRAKNGTKDDQNHILQSSTLIVSDTYRLRN